MTVALRRRVRVPEKQPGARWAAPSHLLHPATPSRKPTPNNMLQHLRPTVRNLRLIQTRKYATAGGDALGEAFIKEREAIKNHAGSSSQLWRKITYFVGFPAIVLALVNAYNLAKEHEHHLEHIKEENGGELPERIQYDYMNIRRKAFPWGNETLFYNPKTNIPPPE